MMVKEYKNRRLGIEALVWAMLVAYSVLGGFVKKAESSEKQPDKRPTTQYVVEGPPKEYIVKPVVVESPPDDGLTADLESTLSNSEEEVKPEREHPSTFLIPFHNPVTNFRANADSAKSAFQGIEIIGNRLTDSHGDTWLNRLLIGGVVGYLDNWVIFSSGKLSRIRENETHGNGELSWDFEVRDPFNLNNNFPMHYRNTPSDRQLIREMSAGPNQSEYNASLFYRGHPEISFADAIASSSLDLMSVLLNLESRRRPGEGDLNTCISLLQDQDIEVDLNDHLMWTLLTKLSSRGTFDSFKLFWDYQEKGKTSAERPKIDLRGIGVDADITYPDSRLYIAPSHGLYVDSMMTANPDGEHPIELGVGAVVAGKNDVLRFGLGYGNLFKWESFGDKELSISPSIHANAYDLGECHIGTTISHGVMKNVFLEWDIFYCNGDVMLNDIMGFGKGVNLYWRAKVLFK